MTDRNPNLPADAAFDEHLQRVLGAARLSADQHQRLRQRLRSSMPRRPAEMPQSAYVPPPADTSPETAILLPASDAVLDGAGGRSRIGAAAGFLGASLAFAVVAVILVLTFRGDGDTNEPLGASPIATAIPPASPTAESAVVSDPQSGIWQIAYASAGLRSPVDGHEQIMVVNADGSDPHNLTNQTGNHTSPNWSPDGEQLVFISDRTGSAELYVMRADGSNLQQITDTGWHKEAPQWSPDGSRIAFACYPDGRGGRADSQICVIDADGSNLLYLSANGVGGYDPAWSPDGTRIAFTGFSEQTEDVYIINADGSNLHRVTTNNLGTDAFASWSPDGQQIAYMSARGDHGGIYVINADGSGDRPLSVDPDRYASGPAWSPDGRTIAFVSPRSMEDRVVYLIDADGSNRREIGRPVGYFDRLSWSPDGAQLAFAAGGSLAVIDVATGEQRTIADGVSADAVPVWRPIRVTSSETPATAEPSATPAADVPTLEEIYAGASETLRQAGMIYHATILTEGAEDSFIRGQTSERWVDASQNVAREDATQRLYFQEEVVFDVMVIDVGGSRHTLYREPEQRLDESPSQACYGAIEAVSSVLGCPGFLEDSTTTVEWGTYDGQAAIVLVTIGTSRGSDESFTFTTRLYLDPDTYLPLREETEGTHTYGPVKTETTYQHEFIPADTLPASFFDPATLATESLEMATPDSTIYWLKDRFDPEGDLPPLVISTVEFGDWGDLGFDTSISYSLDDGSGHEWDVAMMEWSRGSWDDGVAAAVREHWTSKPCYEQIEVELEDGQATIYMGYGDTILPTIGVYSAPPESNTTPCTGEPYTRFEAVVEFDNTAVLVHAQPGSIYRSAAGIEAILRALRPYRSE